MHWISQLLTGKCAKSLFAAMYNWNDRPWKMSGIFFETDPTFYYSIAELHFDEVFADEFSY